MKYVWEEDDIRKGRTACSPYEQTCTIVYDLFPAQQHRPWRLLNNRDSTLSCPYSKVEIIDIFNHNNYSPF